jgi:hypothetical protein
MQLDKETNERGEMEAHRNRGIFPKFRTTTGKIEGVRLRT